MFSITLSSTNLSVWYPIFNTPIETSLPFLRLELSFETLAKLSNNHVSNALTHSKEWVLTGDWQESYWEQLALLLKQPAVQKLDRLHLKVTNFSEGNCEKIKEFIVQQSHPIGIVLPELHQSSQCQRELDVCFSNKQFQSYLQATPTSSSSHHENPPSIPTRKKIKLSTEINSGVQQQNQQAISLDYAINVEAITHFSPESQSEIPLSWKALEAKWINRTLNLEVEDYLTNITEDTWNIWLGHIPEKFQNTITHLTQSAFEQLVRYQAQFQFGLNFGRQLPPGFYVITEGMHANKALDYSTEKVYHNTTPDPLAIQYNVHTPRRFLLSFHTITQWASRTNDEPTNSAESVAQRLWKQLNQASYDREAMLLFRTILPTLLYLSDDSINQLNTLVSSNNHGDWDIESLGFLLKYWPKLHAYSSKETLPLPARSLLVERYGEDKLDVILQFTKRVKTEAEATQRTPSSLLYRLIDNAELKEEIEQLELTPQNSNALLAVHEAKGWDGVKKVVSVFESLRSELTASLFEVFRIDFFSKLSSYLPILTEEYNNAFKAISAFGSTPAISQWWETLFAAHIKAVGPDHLPHLVSAFQAFLEKINDFDLKIDSLSTHQVRELSNTKSLPGASARIVQLLDRCDPIHRPGQWKDIPALDLGSQGAILINSNNIPDRYNFAPANARLTPRHWNPSISLQKQEERTALIQHALKQLEGEALLEAHYRLIACADWSLSATFYQNITQKIMEGKFHPTVTRFLLFLLRATTLGQHLEPALSAHKGGEEALYKEFDTIYKQAQQFDPLCVKIRETAALDALVDHVLETSASFEIHHAAPPISFSTHIELDPAKLIRNFERSNEQMGLENAPAPESTSFSFRSWGKTIKTKAASWAYQAAQTSIGKTYLIPIAISYLTTTSLPKKIRENSERIRKITVNYQEKLYEGLRFISSNNAGDYSVYVDCIERLEKIDQCFDRHQLSQDARVFMKHLPAVMSTFDLNEADFNSLAQQLQLFEKSNQPNIHNHKGYAPLLIQTGVYLRKFSSNQHSHEERSFNSNDLTEFLTQLYPWILNCAQNTPLPQLKSQLLERIKTQFPGAFSDEIYQKLRNEYLESAVQSNIESTFESHEARKAIQACLSHFSSDLTEHLTTLKSLDHIKTQLDRGNGNSILFESFLSQLTHEALYQTDHNLGPNLTIFNQLLQTLKYKNLIPTLSVLIEKTVQLTKKNPTPYYNWIEKACLYLAWVVQLNKTARQKLFTEEILDVLSLITLALSLEDARSIHADPFVQNFFSTLDELIEHHPIAKSSILALWQHYLIGNTLTLDELKHSMRVFAVSIRTLSEQDSLSLLMQFQEAPATLFTLLNRILPTPTSHTELREGPDTQTTTPAHHTPVLDISTNQTAPYTTPVLLSVLIRTVCYGDSLHSFERLQEAYQEEEISEAALNQYYDLPPYPSIDQVLQWNQLSESEADAAYQAFILTPAERGKHGNGFNLAFAKEQARNFKGITFPRSVLKELAKQTQAARHKAPETLLSELRDIQKQAVPSNIPHLIALLAELLYRSNSSANKAYEINTTQYLDLLAITAKPGQSVQLEKAPGEGKSWLTVLTSVLLYSLNHRPVDVITSSLDLAGRDVNEYRRFFNSVGISLHLVTSTSPETAYQNDGIHFSTAAELSLFKQAHLPHQLDSDTEFSGCAVVDEVDYISLDLFDTRFNYSQPSTLWRGMEWIYPEATYFLSTKETEQDKCWLERLETEWEKTYPEFQNHIIRKLGVNEILLDQRRNHLAQVLEAAFSAYQLRFGQDFIIKPNVPVPTHTGIQNSSVALVVQHGRVEENSRYSNGVQECLHALLEKGRQQVNSQITSSENILYLTQSKDVLPALFTSLKPCHLFIVESEPKITSSSTSKKLLDHYKVKIGMTGTAGTQQERREVEKLYGLKTIEVPPHRPCRRLHQPPRLTANQTQQIKALTEYTQAAQTQQRPILIFTKDDNESQTLKDEMAKKDQNNNATLPSFQIIEAGLSDIEKHTQQAGLPCAVTYGTERFARGVNIPVEEDKTGGLLVLGTKVSGFRGEKQMTRRAGRQGQQGEDRLVLNCETLPTTILPKLFLAPEKYLAQLESQRDNEAQTKRLLTHSVNELFDYIWQVKILANPDWKPEERDESYQALLAEFNKRDLTTELQEAKDFEQQQDTLKSVLDSMLNTDRVKQTNPEAWNKVIQPIQELDQLKQHMPTQLLDQKAIVFHQYDHALDGRAKTYDGLFMETRASLLGTRGWFANTRAWQNGHGILFADTRAVWHGERKLFANTRASFCALVVWFKSTTLVCMSIHFIDTLCTWIRGAINNKFPDLVFKTGVGSCFTGHTSLFNLEKPCKEIDDITCSVVSTK